MCLHSGARYLHTESSNLCADWSGATGACATPICNFTEASSAARTAPLLRPLLHTTQINMMLAAALRCAQPMIHNPDMWSQLSGTNLVEHAPDTAAM